MLSNNEEIRLGNETDDIVKIRINSFLNNYQKEELILINGSNFLFYIYINDLHNLQITTDKHNHQIPWYSRETWDQIKIK